MNYNKEQVFAKIKEVIEEEGLFPLFSPVKHAIGIGINSSRRELNDHAQSLEENGDFGYITVECTNDEITAYFIYTNQEVWFKVRNDEELLVLYQIIKAYCKGADAFSYTYDWLVVLDNLKDLGFAVQSFGGFGDFPALSLPDGKYLMVTDLNGNFNVAAPSDETFGLDGILIGIVDTEGESIGEPVSFTSIGTGIKDEIKAAFRL